MIRRLIASLALLAVAAAPAFADLGPGIRVKLTGATGPLVAGTPGPVTFTIDSDHAATLTGFQLTAPRGAAGAGLPVSGLPTGAVNLAANTPYTLPLTVTSLNDDALLKLVFTVGTRKVTNYFDLSRQHFDRMHRPQEAVSLGDLPSIPFDPAGDDDPGAGPPVSTLKHDRPIVDRRDASATKSVQGHNVRVKGRVAYGRRTKEGSNSYVTVGADHVRVRVFDQETGFDDLLYEGRTDADGNFDWNVFCSEDEPDLYLEIATINGAVNVQDDTWSSVWSFETSVRVDYTGTFVNYGSISPGDSYMTKALHMHNTVTRTWRWWHANTSIPIALQAVEFPSGDWAHYDPFGGDIHIPEYIGGVQNFMHVWREATLSHEYGHAIMNEALGYSPPFDYDNGICNNANGDPGHCMWCQEDGGTAVNEGWANFVADGTTTTWEGLYGTAPYRSRDIEDVGMCEDNGAPYYANAFVTEGNFGSLLRDLADPQNEADPAAIADAKDLLNLSVSTVVEPFLLHDIDTPSQYITWFRSMNPGLNANALWSTFANDRYELADNTVPGTVSGLTSTDHTLNVASPDARVSLAWNAASDNFSGVHHYTVQVAASTSGPWTNVTRTDPETNAATSEILATHVDSGYLSVGSWWFRVRAVDRAGNAGSYVTAGPWVVRAPFPADLASTVQTGWDASIVPRNATGATSGNCTETLTRNGNSANTYLNWTVTNIGESSTTGSSRTRVLVDGVVVDSSTTSSSLPAAGGTNFTNNRGPFVVRGGMHTVQVHLDDDEVLAEPNEANNTRSIQYAWLGQSVGLGSRVRRAAPPAPYGGFDGLPGFPLPRYANCDGLAFTQFRLVPPLNAPFAGLWATSTDTTENLNVSLHDYVPNTTALGYATRLAYSSRPAGELDAVLSNTRNRSASTYDAGVVNASLGTHDYFAGAVSAPSTALVAGDSVTITLADTVMLALRDLNLTSTTPQTIEVRRVSGTSPVYTLWLSSTFTVGTLSTYDGKAGMDASGAADLYIVPAASGIHELVFYRNPRDGWGAVTFTVKVRPLKADYAPIAAAGWAGSVIPRGAADATTGNVPAPVSLAGDAPATWVNLAVKNTSDAGGAFVNVYRMLDRTFLGNTVFVLAGQQQGLSVNIGPSTVPAGRHVLGLSADAPQFIPELDEANNRTGRQWVWTPPASPLATPIWRAGTNGGPLEGWDTLDSTQTPSFDVDGLRTPVFNAGGSAGWAAVAIAPRTGSDVDVQLHELATGATHGFDDAIAYSAWDGDATELVLVNFGATAYRAFDAGVLRASNDTSSYSAEIVGAALRGTGISGPFTMGADHLVQLHAIDFAVGHHVVDVVNQSGSVDWAAAAYGGPRPFQNRTDGADVASAWLAPAGQGEHLEFDVSTPGRYAIAVFKAAASERGKSGTYALAVDQAWLGAEPVSGAARPLVASPTPFAANTRLAFALARPGEAGVEVYDVRGARVRTLAAGFAAAGRHELAWAGDDDAGRPLPAGLYFVKLATADRREVTRVVIAR